MSSATAEDVLRPLLLKDLRIQCRARSLNPAGGVESLRQRIKDNMIASGDFSIRCVSEQGVPVTPTAKAAPEPTRLAHRSYGGGESQIIFGDEHKTSYETHRYGPPEPERSESPTIQRCEDKAQFDPMTERGGLPEGIMHPPPFEKHAAPPSQVTFGSYQLPSTVEASGEKFSEPVQQKRVCKEDSLTVGGMIKPMNIKDLRLQLRARNLSPAGAVAELKERLLSHVMETDDLRLDYDPALPTPYNSALSEKKGTEVTSSRPLSARAPPGGATTFEFDDSYVAPSGEPFIGKLRKSVQGSSNKFTAPFPYEDGTVDPIKDDSPSKTQIREPPGGKTQLDFSCAPEKSEEPFSGRLLKEVPSAHSPRGSPYAFTDGTVDEHAPEREVNKTPSIREPPGGKTQVAFSDADYPDKSEEPFGSKLRKSVKERGLLASTDAPYASQTADEIEKAARSSAEASLRSSQKRFPPGGKSQISFDDDKLANSPVPFNQTADPAVKSYALNSEDFLPSKEEGSQNGDKVPPGGHCQIVFG